MQKIKYWKYVQILAASKNQADCKILACREKQADGKILAGAENQADGKILAGVEISSSNEILAVPLTFLALLNLMISPNLLDIWAMFFLILSCCDTLHFLKVIRT
jgi:hypothetical protein